MNNTEFGELHILEDGKMKILPTYCCGHCTSVIVMRSDRKRDRIKCFKCQKFLCEKNSLCMGSCTPLNALARDHFENAGEYGRLVPAIMNGATTMDEAVERKLILP